MPVLLHLEPETATAIANAQREIEENCIVNSFFNFEEYEKLVNSRYPEHIDHEEKEQKADPKVNNRKNNKRAKSC